MNTFVTDTNPSLGNTDMTQVIDAPRTARFAAVAAMTRPTEATRLLRDAAFVMAMTQKVKAEITRPTLRPASRIAELVG